MPTKALRRPVEAGVAFEAQGISPSLARASRGRIGVSLRECFPQEVYVAMPCPFRPPSWGIAGVVSAWVSTGYIDSGRKRLESRSSRGCFHLNPATLRPIFYPHGLR